MEEEEPPALGKLVAFQRGVQHYLDKTVIWIKVRWTIFVLALIGYGIRVYFREGFYIVTYGLGIYFLNLFIGFLSPAIDPDEGQATLPTSDKEEYRPFSRKVPEFKFWIGAIRAVIIAFTMTFFQMFDLPVFWPILLAYFILLVMLTMRDRIAHMMKHRYLPFNLGGKQTYGELAKVKPPAEPK